jgi:hypothetical protein
MQGMAEIKVTTSFVTTAAEERAPLHSIVLRGCYSFGNVWMVFFCFSHLFYKI